MRTRRILPAALLPLVLAACGGGSEHTLPKPAEQHLVYVAGNSPKTARVWVANTDGSHPQRLTRGSVAVLTPDGKTLAIQRPDGIYVLSSHGGSARRLTPQRLEPRAWSPDGKTLVATKSGPTAVTALMLIDRSTGQARTLARGSLYGFDFSPKGDELVYARAPVPTENGICSDNFDLYVAKVAGGTPKRLTHNGYSAFPVWGPSKIAFARYPQSFNLEDCAAPGIWTIDPNGSNPKAIIERSPNELSVSGDYGLQPLAWLDDNHLLTGVRTDFGTEGAVLDAGTGNVRQLTNDYADEASRDGRFFVGSGGSDQLELTITRVSDGKRLFLRKDACCPDWNR